MNRRMEFVDVFLRGAGPSPELLGAFSLGLMVVGILSNLGYDLVISPQEHLRITWRPLLASAVLTVLAYGLYRRDRRRRRRVRATVDEGRLAPPHAGLIWMLGPGSFDHLVFALEHHLERGGGTHCWLVMDRSDQVRRAFSQLSQQLTEEGVPTQLHPVYLSELDVHAAHQAVRTVFDREAREAGIAPAEVIADITGGTKPLTAGMVLAALTAGGKLEYVESERDARGEPILATRRVVLVEPTFSLDQGEEQ